MISDPGFLIRHLNLTPLPGEGGYFAQSYESRLRFGGRSLATAIYYLLTPANFSAMHRLQGDEIFHFYLGDPADMLQLHPDGGIESFVLGQDLEAGMKLQALVPGRSWQGTALRAGGRFALFGTTMAPGFDFEDFELGRREALVREYPAATEAIVRLTH